MKKTADKTIKAFTLAEILISLSVLGVVCAITLFTMISSVSKSKSEIIISSQNFYNTAYGIYMKLTSYSTDRFNIAADDSEKLLNGILQYMDFSSANIDCEEVNFNSFEADKCARLTSGIKIGVKVSKPEEDDTQESAGNTGVCNMTLDVYEYLQKEDKDLKISDIQTRNVKDACGYIIYRTKKSHGIFKEDAFIIPLGKRKFK